MRRFVLSRRILLYALLCSMFGTVSGLALGAQIACSSVSVHKYAEGGCTITVNREVPGSPLPVQVPAHTRVTILVINQRQTEVIKFVTTTDAIASQDLLQGFVKQVITPLSTVVFTVGFSANPCDDATIEQNEAVVSLNDVAERVNRSNVELSCLQAFTTFKDGKCTTDLLKSEAVEQAASNASSRINEQTLSTSAVGSIALLDDDIKKLQTACSSSCPERTRLSGLLTKQAQLRAKLAEVQAGQATLVKAKPALDAIRSFKPIVIPPIENVANKKATVKITAQEQIGKTSSDIATAVITWQSTNWELSTGLMLSSLANRSFSNAPIYNADGTPDLDATGKVKTKVSVSPTYPSVVFPLVMAGYKWHTAQGHDGKWSFAASGGVGANLSSKTADFAAGPSLQYRSILITPVFHWGRQLQLTNGVKLGQELGTSPPALPTQTMWRPAGGLAISYIIPIP